MAKEILRDVLTDLPFSDSKVQFSATKMIDHNAILVFLKRICRSFCFDHFVDHFGIYSANDISPIILPTIILQKLSN